ncbi:MAG: acyl-CoA dehydrogenase family protein [Alphaproteobacteria bacterium]|nr:acyl-CoA dehydrogenase family protein [Alphaproteobacteria bacterium]MDP6515467.1 acyl-CoA dehydrogenase family protein [Alphaproteobacteria bacterium]
MDFTFTSEQEQIRAAIERVCARFDDAYWLARDRSGEFPHDFSAAIAADGWLGIAMPPEYGGAGLGITEAALMMHTIAASGAAMSGCSAVHMNIFGPNTVVVFGTDEQKARMLPPLIRGEERACFGVTEPDSGLDTTHLKTRAVLDGDHYLVNGRKVWTSTAQEADKILLIARTTPLEDCAKASDGLSLFYTDLDRDRVEVREIEKMGRHAVDSNALFIDDLVVPVADRIGDDGKGFQYLLHGLNPERVLVAAEGVGIGKAALGRGAAYARERVVFGRPIGQNQAIQHPLAESWCELEAAELMTFKAAALYDAGEPCGLEANAAKFLAARAGLAACERAVLTHGGFGYAREFHVERLLREQWINRIAPVSEQLLLCYIAERALDMPKSY